MTTTTLITANAVLGAVVVYGLLHLLVGAVWSDRRHTEAQFEVRTPQPGSGYAGNQVASPHLEPVLPRSGTRFGRLEAPTAAR